MNVEIQFFAQLGQAAGTSAMSVELEPPCTAQELVARLAAEHGKPFSQLVLDESGALHPTVLLFVGQDQIAWHEPAELRHRDTVLLLSPIAGG